MRLKASGENWLERLATWVGWAPTPIIDTLQAMLLCRTIMAAARLGVFEAIGTSSRRVPEVANAIAAHPLGVEKLLDALVAAKYLKYQAGEYSLTRAARRWLLPASPTSLHDNLLFRYMEWDAVENLESFVRTGQAIDAHQAIDAEDWQVYQRGLAAIARLSTREVVRAIRLPPTATRMLDVGGGHGEFALAFCHRYSQLQATILELPQAIDAARQVFTSRHAGHDVSRIQFRTGDALSNELGESDWDLVFISQLVHHFSDDTNRVLMQRVARSLRENGLVVIQEIIRPPSPGAAGQLGQLLDLFFAMTSQAGTWSEVEILGWLRMAGLCPQPIVRLRMSRGVSLIVARKSTRNAKERVVQGSQHAAASGTV